ncbi:MAG: anaerobic ribonucleoside-triphosphate reductase activating protein [Bacilli bacterium]|nr:anaerobic ribonucleoside-triphosphate reductase activating protein [Bacilli bacterium]MDD3305022.1 anaerobic ribonucleoside-triphosphate reductase activating protein [Bacilli bacterium]MDD4053647.1 anaerobic ribonucleoside-triphosphate reductase activating protein [Bacilli bacterium]MDD4411146.1 anaerobic ribonucleoside-triphosphate reductase activating protein [Bacilli bacterium]
MKIRLASELQYDSIVDGEGIRTVIWTQGCPHKCPGCHNPSTHDFAVGFSMDVDDVKKQISSYKNQDGITLSGGDPFSQPEACYEIASYAKKQGLNVWCYTGYTYEALLVMAKSNDIYLKLLQKIDVLIDGKFIVNLRNLSLKFRGSSNQRVIDVQKSLESGAVTLVTKYQQINIGLDLYEKPDYIFV